MKPIGRLEHQITLQQMQETNNGGQIEDGFVDVAVVWAEVKSLRGSEAFEYARSQARETIRVRIHYRDDVGTGWRILYEGQFYYISYVDATDKRRGELWFTAELTDAK